MADMTWTTAIAEVRDDDVVVRGHRLNELIGKVGFTDMVFLVIRGDLPGPAERSMLDAIMVSLIDHGISPSSIIARTLASCGTPIQASLAGASLSIADWHGGSGEEFARLLVETVEQRDAEAADTPWPNGLEAVAEQLVTARRAARAPIPGFGHPQHADGDPRARRLLDLAAELEVAGRYAETLTVLGGLLADSTGREALRYPNITGALAAILLDLGFPWRSVRGLVIGSRAFGLTAHVVEELEQGNRWRHAPADQVTYTGPSPA